MDVRSRSPSPDPCQFLLGGNRPQEMPPASPESSRIRSNQPYSGITSSGSESLPQLSENDAQSLRAPQGSAEFLRRRTEAEAITSAELLAQPASAATVEPANQKVTELLAAAGKVQQHTDQVRTHYTNLINSLPEGVSDDEESVLHAEAFQISVTNQAKIFDLTKWANTIAQKHLPLEHELSQRAAAEVNASLNKLKLFVADPDYGAQTMIGLLSTSEIFGANKEIRNPGLCAFIGQMEAAQCEQLEDWLRQAQHVDRVNEASEQSMSSTLPHLAAIVALQERKMLAAGQSVSAGADSQQASADFINAFNQIINLLPVAGSKFLELANVVAGISLNPPEFMSLNFKLDALQFAYQLFAKHPEFKNRFDFSAVEIKRKIEEVTAQMESEWLNP